METQYAPWIWDPDEYKWERVSRGIHGRHEAWTGSDLLCRRLQAHWHLRDGQVARLCRFYYEGRPEAAVDLVPRESSHDRLMKIHF